jgi:hypothetical protein
MKIETIKKRLKPFDLFQNPYYPDTVFCFTETGEILIDNKYTSWAYFIIPEHLLNDSKWTKVKKSKNKKQETEGVVLNLKLDSSFNKITKPI